MLPIFTLLLFIAVLPAARLQNTKSNSTLTGKIYNGDIYDGRKYAVYLGEGSEILCTGTFILFHTILIAAHCVSHLEPPSYGGYKIIYITKESSSDASSTIVYDIRRIVVHPAFTLDTDPYYIADIAVILVKQNINDVNKDCEVTPEWIPLFPDIIKSDSKGYVLGWGPDSGRAGIVSEHLKMLQLTVMNNSICNKKFKTDKIKNSHVCAISQKGNIVVEDAGAPLIQQVYHPENNCFVEMLVGIAVFSNNVEKFPAVYTRISAYHKYIFDTMMNLEEYAKNHPISPEDSYEGSPERRAMESLSIDSNNEASSSKKSRFNRISSLFKKPKK